MQSQPSRTKHLPTYESRILACSRCGTCQETKWMQLRTTNGYRAIHCKGCKKQETVARTKCQCDVIWHRCELHRNDPDTHSSKKGVKGIRRKQRSRKLDKEGTWSSKRKAPITNRNEATSSSYKKRRRIKGGEEVLISHARRVVLAYPPGKIATDKLKRKLEEKSEDVNEGANEDRPSEAGYRHRQVMTDGPGRHNMFGSLLTSEPGTGSAVALRGPFVTEPDSLSLGPHHLVFPQWHHCCCQPCGTWL